MKISITKDIKADNVAIEAGSVLQFNDKGQLTYKGQTVNATSIAALEAWSDAALPTKGTLAVRGIVAHIASVLDMIPAADKPELMRIFRAAAETVSSGSAAFLSRI